MPRGIFQKAEQLPVALIVAEGVKKIKGVTLSTKFGPLLSPPISSWGISSILKEMHDDDSGVRLDFLRNDLCCLFWTGIDPNILISNIVYDPRVIISKTDKDFFFFVLFCFVLPTPSPLSLIIGMRMRRRRDQVTESNKY